MGLASIVLGVLALVLMFAGFLATPIPFLGTLLAFLAPVLALAGIVLGGVALSRARDAGEGEGFAIGGLVVNVVAFVPAMLVAVTCGLCNTLCTGIALTPPADPGATPWYRRDAGPSPFDLLLPDAGAPHPALAPTPVDPVDDPVGPPEPQEPGAPPTLPPPPLPVGPSAPR